VEKNGQIAEYLHHTHFYQAGKVKRGNTEGEVEFTFLANGGGIGTVNERL